MWQRARRRCSGAPAELLRPGWTGGRSFSAASTVGYWQPAQCSAFTAREGRCETVDADQVDSQSLLRHRVLQVGQDPHTAGRAGRCGQIDEQVLGVDRAGADRVKVCIDVAKDATTDRVEQPLDAHAVDVRPGLVALYVAVAHLSTLRSVAAASTDYPRSTQ
ncbi:hypothetical protein AD006_31010 (plasmid) [Pseudonocardia sp. EC080610-09]|nr:hypothetical protein AD006_31010 [Pseudonocardia sp. EC080610-09]ALL85421.1 hypothetical protein AD017_30220 [Pseudonocardia sp. EC080619-01]